MEIDLTGIDLQPLKQFVKTRVPEHFKKAPGEEAYALYAYISENMQEGSTIADLGTLQGLSALALSYNPDIKVISYDIDLSKNIVGDKDNIEFIEKNMFDDLDRILECDLILLDVDPHDGIQELDFFDILEEKKYKGNVLCDDIHHNLGMQNFWHKVKRSKMDLTEYGHHSGTGFVEFK